MALVDGTPSIRLEGDKAKATALIPEGRLLLYKVQSVVRNSHVSTFSMQRRIDENSYVYALHAYGQNIIFISSDSEVPDKIDIPILSSGGGSIFPDFYSGLVYNGYINYYTGKPPPGSPGAVGENGYLGLASFSPTPACNQIFPELNMGQQVVTRLAVYPWSAFNELNNPDPSGEDYSQYTRLRSSMYSGTMAKVVQLVMGYGYMGEAKMRYPDGSKFSDPNSEQFVIQSISTGVQIRYDYKFNRTHGITVGSDGVLWLVEIGLARGVLARPLPLMRNSTTEAFRERAEKRGDRAMVYALDELGGLPSGEAFPGNITPALLNGDVIRLMEPADLQRFYSCTSYSSSMGWAFNDRGTEAHNTAYYFGDDGYQRGVWYRIDIRIGAVNKDRQPGEPIGSGSATLNLAEENPMYAPPIRNQRYFPMKFYEPQFPGLISHDASPMQGATGQVPDTNTVMFVCFINGDLHTLRYFRSARTEYIEQTTTDELPGECLYDGSWNTTQVSGTRTLSAMPYTNIIDWRSMCEEHYINTTRTVTAVGFLSPVVADFIQAPEACRVTRRKLFRSVVETEEAGGEQWQGAAAVPRYCRSSYSLCYGHWYDGGKAGSITVTYPTLGDPNVAYGWRCFPRIASIPWPTDIGCARENCGGSCTSGGQGEHSDRKVVCMDTEYQACSEFADSGPFITMCQSLDPFVGRGERLPEGSSERWSEGNAFESEVFTYAEGYGGAIENTLTEYHFKEVWMHPSPDPETGLVQHMYGTYSCLGSPSLVVQTGIDGGIFTSGYAPDRVGSGATTPFPTFIGVNIP